MGRVQWLRGNGGVVSHQLPHRINCETHFCRLYNGTVHTQEALTCTLVRAIRSNAQYFGIIRFPIDWRDARLANRLYEWNFVAGCVDRATENAHFIQGISNPVTNILNFLDLEPMGYLQDSMLQYAPIWNRQLFSLVQSSSQANVQRSILMRTRL